MCIIIHTNVTNHNTLLLMYVMLKMIYDIAFGHGFFTYYQDFYRHIYLIFGIHNLIFKALRVISTTQMQKFNTKVSKLIVFPFQTQRVVFSCDTYCII